MNPVVIIYVIVLTTLIVTFAHEHRCAERAEQNKEL